MNPDLVSGDNSQQQPSPQQTLNAAQNPDRTAMAPTSSPSPSIAPTQSASINPPAKPAQTWGDRVYHGVLSALAGSEDVSLERDPKTGRMIATSVKSGPGQQWKRIIAGAISGYAGAAATGATGPGSTSAKIGAGFKSGFQMRKGQIDQQREQANEDFDLEQKAATTQAQNALLTHQVTKGTFDLGRAQVEAAASDLDRENTFSQLISQGGAGSQDLGVFPAFGDVMTAFKKDPTLHDHQAGGRIIAIPHINADGKVDGVHAALVSPDWLNSKINQDLPIATRTYKDGKLEESTFTIPAGSLTGDQYAKLVMSQSADSLKDYNDQIKEKREASRTTAENTRDYAAAAKDREDASLLSGAGDETLVDSIGRGQAPVGKLAYLLARKPELMQAVIKKYPGFDGSKVDGYSKLYNNFTSGPVSAQLNSGGAVLQHLNELAQMNTNESHIPGTPDYNAYMNKADTVSTELATFYGTPTIPAIAAIHKTLTKTLPGSRLKGIMTQGQSMGDKFDSYVQQWKNGAPSVYYEAQMPNLSPNAIAALKTLNPKYDKSDLAVLEGTRARLGVGNQPQQQQAAPGTQQQSSGQQWSAAAWKAANPNGDVDAATKAAKAAGYQVVN